MTPTNVMFMLAIPLGLAGIVGLVLLSGRLCPTVRRRFERALIAVFYPGMAIFFGYRAVQAAMDAEWLAFALSAVLGALLAAQGLQLFRKPLRADGTRT